MKMLYYCRVNKDDHENYGVVRKCEAQAKAFRKLGFEVDLVYLCNKGILKNDELIHSFSFPWLNQRWTTYLFYFFLLLRIINRKIDTADYQVIYLRYAMTHPLLMKFLKNVKHKNPQQQIILEIPTYPYDKEPSGVIHKLSLAMDRMYRTRLASVVDYIGHYGLDKEIYGIPVIPLRNGISVEGIKVSGSIPIPGVLRLIGVANWNYWHGLDRLLEGLGKYYQEGEKEIRIQLEIIGGGRALASYKKIVGAYGLENHVEFIPPVIGEKLDAHFDQADIGIGCLGLFRKGVKLDSSLKTREYCSRGIPFIFSGVDLDFRKEVFFVKQIPHEEAPVDMDEILSFWRELRSGEGEWHNAIRNFAEINLTWEKQLEGMGRKMRREE